MKWQPIETAPKDGTEFLAYDSRTKKMDVCFMNNWHGPWTCQQSQMDGELGPFIDEFGHKSADITHWMPLPEPPR